MRKEVRVFCVVFIALFLFPAGICAAQTQTASVSKTARSFQNGAELYALSRWQEATVEFRRAQESAETLDDWARSIYWVIMSELAHSDYGSALRDMDQLEKNAPNSKYTRDVIYHRARVYFNQGFFDDALVLFNRFTNSVSDNDRIYADRKAAAFFWIGECLFTMVQYDEAEKFYSWVIARYPKSVKVEASAYRLDLIKQKKIENELLALLQLSHEEALRTSEEYQRTIRTYEHTLNTYQKRLSDPYDLNQNLQDGQIAPQLDSQYDNTGTESGNAFFYASEENRELIERATQLRNELQWILEEGTFDQ